MILAERRQGGAFTDLADFHKRTKSSAMNKKVLQGLACAGAFDCLEPQRSKLIERLDDIDVFLRGPEKQVSMFSDFDSGPEGDSVLPSKEVTRLDIAMLEKQAIGLFLTRASLR